MIRDSKIKKWFYSNTSDDHAEISRIRDVEYAHITMDNGDDLYFTTYGLPYFDQLRPDNFLTDHDWFRNNSERLSGTSSIYRVRTKKVNGRHKDIVLKWNRMGQDIPGAESTEDLMFAEFNSPFEEFSLVMELRHAMRESLGKIIIQKPLAIYVPKEPVQAWRTGRKKHKMQRKIVSHKDVDLHMSRTYAVIYEWLPGMDAVQAQGDGLIDREIKESLYFDSEERMRYQGFLVRDNKPEHIIVKPRKDGTVHRDTQGRFPYGIVDFELLERTPERETEVRKNRRKEYLKRQRDRFSAELPETFHPHLQHVNFFGVDYIYGHVESTKGRLWVVGKDPYLFDYFLPERWRRNPKTKISLYGHMFYTVTKDNVHLAWKVSNVGLYPNMDPFREDERRVLEYGYNSPFEEIGLAIELWKKGISTIYPRAIYMSGKSSEIPENLFDESRYSNHEGCVTPDNIPIMEKNRDYIIIWGYWNGPDERLAEMDGDYYYGIDTLQACREGIITRDEYLVLVRAIRERLLAVGIEDLNLRGDHLLISLDSRGKIITDDKDMPELRICNFEFLRRMK